jgi:hypothetical protein
MKKLYCAIFLLFFIPIHTFAQNFLQLKNFGSKLLQEEIIGICSENSGSVVFLLEQPDTGKINSSNGPDTLTFDSILFIYKTTNDRAMYLVRMDEKGKIVNAKNIGNFNSPSNYGAAFLIPAMLAKGENNNYYVTGNLPSSQTIGGVPMNKINGKVLFAKFDKDFNLLWAKQTGNSTTSTPYQIIYSSGHLYFICKSTDNTIIGKTTYTFGTKPSFIFGELNPKDGEVLWSKSLVNTVVDNFFEITGILHLDNKIVVSGNTEKGTKLGKDTIYAGSFIAELDSIGNYKKSVSFYAKRQFKITCLTTDNEDIYFGGLFKDSVTFGKQKIAPEYATGVGALWDNQECFAASISSNLQPRWFYRPKVISRKLARDNLINIVNCSNGYLYFSGYIRPNTVFEKDTLEGDTIGAFSSLVFKMDNRGNVLWAKSGGSATYLKASSALSNKAVYLGGSNWFDVKFGNLKPSFVKNVFGFDAWIVKVSDNSITRGKVKSGPYCAADTIKIPYSKNESFDTSNYFIAELSDEYGNFESNYFELGRLKSNKDSVIIGKLPQFKVVSSAKYRIRVRSTKPQVQSFYKMDTLRLLIYSKDKANPGLPETICYGDSIKLNTYGGTKWNWSPKLNMDDSTKRQPIVWPKSTTTYKIIISDSSGCGAPDTAYKVIKVKQPLKTVLATNDTTACGNDLKIPYYFTGGDSLNYKFQWYYISSPKLWFALKKGEKVLADTLNYPASDPIEKLAIILKDGCTNKPDTAYLTIRQRQKINIKSSFKDTSLCSGHKLRYKVSITGGVSKYIKYQWKDLISNSVLSNTDSLAFTTATTEKIQLIVNDGCEALGDTAEFKVEVKAKLKAVTNLRDSTICFGKNLNLSSKAIGGDSSKYTFSWLLDKKIISSSASFILKTEDHFLTTGETKKLILVLKDNCSLPNDSMIKTINVKPSPKANFSYDIACSRTITNFQFTGNKPSAPTTTTFNWDFNKESSSTLENPSKLFATIGTKKIKLTATSSNGCIDTLTKDILVKFQSIADFTVNDVCQSDSAIFTNQSKDATNYNWKFGDGKNSNLKAPKHKYQIPSTTTFNVTLVAIVKDGCSDSISKPLTINELPNSDFSITKVNQNVDLKANKNGLVSYKWVRHWKDGTKDSITKTTNIHSYTYHENIKNICLTSTDNLGCQSQTCKDPSTGASKSINAIPIAIGIKIYPNPASETITIETEGLDNNEFSIQMINSLGQIVLERTAIQHSTFNIQHLPEGVYLVRVVNGEKVWNQKVIVSFGNTKR